MSFIDTFRRKVADQAPADKYVVWVVLALGVRAHRAGLLRGGPAGAEAGLH